MKHLRRTSSVVTMSLSAVLEIDLAEAAPIAVIQPLSGPLVLDGMTHDGSGERTWARPEDHQLVVPVSLAALTKAGQPKVGFGAESTALGRKL